MKKNNWDDHGFDDSDDDISEPKKHHKQVKRKWREIEHVKERQRLKRELQSYDSYYH